jgi:glycosyl hydrolase family 2
MTSHPFGTGWRFGPASADSDRPVFLDFAAAMTRATVTLNGAEVANHLGGYLPFSVEVSSLLRARGNVLAVRLDSTFNLNVPPDRPAPEPATSVDYWGRGRAYPGPLTIGPRPDALDPGFHGVRTHWIRGFHGVSAGPAHTDGDADGAGLS